MRSFFTIIFLSLTLCAVEQPAGLEGNQVPEASPATQSLKAASITRLPDGTMQIGEITFDPKKRAIRVPCYVNMADGLLEYALVHENGKLHESLLATTASPLHLNVAMKILNYTPSEELYHIEKEKGVSSGRFPQVTEEVRKAARINIFVEFTRDGKTIKHPLRDLILNNVTETSMPHEDWIYGGSFISDGKFFAEATGDIASIFVSRGSLILFAGKENQNDEVWVAHTKRLPEVGTKAVFIIEPTTSPPNQKKKP